MLGRTKLGKGDMQHGYYLKLALAGSAICRQPRSAGRDFVSQVFRERRQPNSSYTTVMHD